MGGLTGDEARHLEGAHGAGQPLASGVGCRRVALCAVMRMAAGHSRERRVAIDLRW